MIVSILTKQYREYYAEDLDINILFDIFQIQKQNKKRNLHDEIREYQGQINDKTISVKKQEILSTTFP